MKRNHALNKNFVDVFNWKVTPKEFSDWIIENDILISAVQDGSDGWVFVNDEDCLAFKLKFQPKQRRTEMDAGYFYCPYIPPLLPPICPSPPSDLTI